MSQPNPSAELAEYIENLQCPHCGTQYHIFYNQGLCECNECHETWELEES
jgi:protein-arginine kinase activator protein McsA